MPSFLQSDLTGLTTGQLRALFHQSLGRPTASRNRPWLIRRICAAPSFAPDPPPTTVSIPPVGQEIRKTWRGRHLVVRVQADGFLLNGTVYRSLSAAATALCGGNRNGLVFFGLKPRPAKATAAVAVAS